MGRPEHGPGSLQLPSAQAVRGRVLLIQQSLVRAVGLPRRSSLCNHKVVLGPALFAEPMKMSASGAVAVPVLELLRIGFTLGPGAWSRYNITRLWFKSPFMS